MLKRIIAWSATHPLAVGIGTVALIIAGVWAMLNTSVDAIPDLSDAQVIEIGRASCRERVYSSV